MTDLSAERIEEIRRGCEGVTDGPWEARDAGAGRWSVGSPTPGAYYTLMRILLPQDGQLGTNVTNATHTARLDPQTVAALCDLAMEGLRARTEAKEPETDEQPLSPEAQKWLLRRIGSIAAALQARKETGE